MIEYLRFFDRLEERPSVLPVPPPVRFFENAVDGTFTIRAEVVGKNDKSQKTGTYFGLDRIVVDPQ